jgi:hypothetical protein
VPLSIDYFDNDHRSIALSEGGGFEMPINESPAAVEPNLTGPGNCEIFQPHSSV